MERRLARINVKVIVVLVVVLASLFVGGALVLRMRRQAIADRAFAAGQAALKTGDWINACKQLKIYLAKRPEDFVTLEQFAKANVKVHQRSQRHTIWAIKAYRRLLRQKPGDDTICEALSKLYLEVGDLSEAAYVSRQRLEVDPTDEDASFTLGTVLVGQRKSQEATHVLEELIARHPDRVRAYALLSNVALQEGTPSGKDQAMAWLDQAVTANPDSAEARVFRARYDRLVHHDRHAATLDLNAAEALSLSDPNVRLSLAQEWLMLGAYDRASVHSQALTALDEATLSQHHIYPPDMKLALLSLDGMLALRQGDKQQAGAVAAQGLAAFPKGRRRTAFLPLAAELLITAGDLDQARQCLADYRKKLKATGPGSKAFREELIYLESLADSVEGNHYDAINRLEGLLGGSPKHLRARRLLAASFVSTRQWRMAAREYKRYLRSVPQDASAILQYVSVCRKIQDLPEYLKASRDAERLMPENMEAKRSRIDAELRLMGRNGRDLSRLTTLATELSELQKTSGDQGAFDVLRARLAALQGQPDQAIEMLKRSTESAPDALPPMLELVARYAATGSTDQAIATCREACRRHPAATEPLVILANLLDGDERYEAAAEALRSAIPGFDGEDKLKLQVLFAQLEMQHGDREAGITRLRQLAVEHPENAKLRHVLLLVPEVFEDPNESQSLVDELHAIEGERGIRWPVEQARVWLRTDTWKEKAANVEAMLTRCMTADPQWQAPALLLGGMFQRLGRDGDAEELYHRAIDNNPSAGDVAERLVSLLVHQQRFSEADAILSRIQSDSPALKLQRVASAMRQGQYGLAIDELRRRVAADAADAQSRVQLAQVVYGTLHDASQALHLLDEAQAISPDLLEAATTRARIIHLERGPEAAEKILSDEVERRGDFAAYLSRARYYADTGRLDEADRDYTHLTTFPSSSAKGYRLLGIFRQSHGRREQAVNAWKEGLRQYPDDVELQRHLIKAYASSGEAGERKQGRVMLDALLERYPEDSDLLYDLASAWLSQGTNGAVTRAHDILEKVVSLDPHNTSAYLKLIAIARERGDANAADQALTRAFSANPNDWKLDLTQAELQLDRGNPEVSREIALRAQTREPNRAAPKILLATIALRGGDADGARKLIDEALRLEPTNERAQLLRAHLLFRSGARDQAIQKLEAFRQSASGRGRIAPLLALAEMCRLHGDGDAAARYLDQAVQLEPDRVDVFKEKLAQLAASEHFDELVREVGRRLTTYPHDYSVLLLAGSLLPANTETSFARQVERWYALVPVEADAYGAAQLALARLAFQQGDFDNAVAAYRRILAKEPDQPQALNDLAWILGVQYGEGEEAIALANRGVTRYPDDPHLLDTRGTLLFRANRLTDAQHDLERCLVVAAEIPTTRAIALLHLSRVYMKLGEPNRAKGRLEEAATLDEHFHVFTEEQRNELSRLLKQTSSAPVGSKTGQ